ncbi:MAG: MetQ/NlpA family ABC transporter substrate-binding protein [Desulfitobacteriaceae bacterium]|nr:MetQ/NlpA family ABC transporter substrate-binding protein [Desulfitobacteriaceae bacterium]MDI6879763.1 MetQ/NlpA family ABC transporter substrate-binding protein [Desulfitobacteriaceae bacterium]MDI6913315.1 MetQ/NlpA family ABC transporter substrate-binding protein [Desulfitobacteriaceae bacterium]
MFQKRNHVTLLVVLVLSLAIVLTGCGTTAPNKATAPQNGGATGTAAKAVTLKVGATPVPHAEILEFVKPILAKDGVNLDIVPFTDYVQPNLALDKGDIDANFFQHQPYLDSFNKDHNLKLVTIAKVHIEPMGLYSKKVKKVDEFKNGDTIAIPNDPSNAGRALALLQKAGLIKLREGVGIKGTAQDIIDNPKQLKVKMLDAAQLPRVLQDVAGAVINTNFALEAKLNPTQDAMFIEDKDSPYANILVVKDIRTGDPNLQKLAKVLNSPEVKKFIEDKYKGSIVAAF